MIIERLFFERCNFQCIECSLKNYRLRVHHLSDSTVYTHVHSKYLCMHLSNLPLNDIDIFSDNAVYTLECIQTQVYRIVIRVM